MNLHQLPALENRPLVSVIIVNYNYERYLPEAIESVLAQTYQNFEIVICDDGSKDSSRDVISRYAAADARIKPIFKENGGVASALNTAYNGSKGEIICLLDADDLFLPEKINKVVERLKPGGRRGMVLNKLTKVNSDGMTIGSIPEFGDLDRGELREKILQTAAHWSVAPTAGISFRRECADKVFPIPDPTFRTEADGYMSTVAPLFYAVDVIDEALTVYRVHSSNLTASSVVDVKWCERAMSAGERVFAVLERIAAENGWSVTKLEHNPTYCEMRLIRDYLQGAQTATKLRNIRDLRAAADRVQTRDRAKTRAKALVLSSAALLPLSLGVPIINKIYLPSSLKRISSGITRAFGT